MNAKRCVIVGSAPLGGDSIRRLLRQDDFVIFCDGGLAHSGELDRSPDLIVGDFDSYRNPGLDVETIVLPRAKDDTDTVFAVKEALRRGFGEFLLVGVTGGRIDHTLANLSILLMLDTLGKPAKIVDSYSEIEVVSGHPAYIDGSFPYFSLLNISGVARDITVENAKFPLSGAEINCDYQYGVSNEVLPGLVAKVTVGEGRLLLVKVRRDM